VNALIGRMHRVREQHGFVVAQGIQQIIVALDESLLLVFVELARDHVRLVILQPQAMQKRDQSRAAFVDKGAFLLDPGADLACRKWQRRADPGLQSVLLLLHAQIACAPAHIEAHDAFDWRLYPIGGSAPGWSRYTRAIRVGDFVPLSLAVTAGQVMMLEVGTRQRNRDFVQDYLRVFGP
jgi:hypothetical protein